MPMIIIRTTITMIRMSITMMIIAIFFAMTIMIIRIITTTIIMTMTTKFIGYRNAGCKSPESQFSIHSPVLS